jgi:hypothetical protein
MASVRHLGLFPFCALENDDPVGANTHYPIGVNIETAMRWYWRVKTWSVNGSITKVTTSTITGDLSVQAGSEKVLVCEGGLFDQINDDGTSVAILFFTSVVKRDGLYYPELVAEFQGAAGGPILHTLEDGAGTSPVSGNFFTFDGIAVPSFLGNGGTAAFLNIEAQEYWPYDPGDGLGPIYNATTGEQLRQFPE